MKKLRYWSITHEGMKRKLNEDYYAVIEKQNLAILCDGMGGHVGGDIASRFVVETIESFFDSTSIYFQSEELFDAHLQQLPRLVAELVAAIRMGNRRIYNTIIRQRQLAGMGTTIVASIPHNEMLYTCHVGDSRLYRIRNHKIQQITKDHSWLNELLDAKEITEEEASHFQEKNVITRAIGIDPCVKIDVTLCSVQKNDLFILCSDGLSDVLSDEEILNYVTSIPSEPKESLKEMVKEVNRRGGPDNITIILGQADEEFPLKNNRKTSQIFVPKESTALQEVEDKFLKRLFGKTQISDIPVDYIKKPFSPIKIGAIATLAFIVLVLVLWFGIFNKKNESSRIKNAYKLSFTTKPDDCLIEIKYFKNDSLVQGITPYSFNLESKDTVLVSIEKEKYKKYSKKYYGTSDFSKSITLEPQMLVQLYCYAWGADGEPEARLVVTNTESNKVEKFAVNKAHFNDDMYEYVLPFGSYTIQLKSEKKNDYYSFHRETNPTKVVKDILFKKPQENAKLSERKIKLIIDSSETH